MTRPQQSSAARVVNSVRPRHPRYWRAALTFSLILNLILLWQLRPWRNPVVSPTVPAETKNAPGKRAGANREDKPQVADRLEWRWENLSTLDFRTLRSRLLAGECPERTIRAILEIMIDREYRPRLADLFGQIQGNFWDQHVVAKTGRNAPRTPEQTKAAEAFSSLQQERDRMMQELVDPDWDRHGSPRFRDRDQAESHTDMLATALQAEHESEWTQFLTPEEAEEYRLRRSPFNHVVQNLYSFEPSIHERQAIIRLYETYNGKVPDEELERALGSERSVQFQRARDPSYESIYKVGTHLGVQEKQMISAFELKQAAKQQAKTIRGRRDLDKSQKAELLGTLEQSTLTGLAERFGPSGPDLYLRNGGWWIKELTELGK